MDNTALEQEMKDKGLTAPKVTEESITAKIDSETYIRTPAEGLTVCKITLHNGFSFIGHSACVSPQNYDRDIGDRLAREMAFRQIWSHEGYLLKEVLYQAKLIRGHQHEPFESDDDLQAALGQPAHASQK